MKLSVLIPTYNYTCFKLVQDLHEQLLQNEIDFEVIVMDDGSRDQVTIIANRKINELSGCRYVYNQENIGRAATRNRLADVAKGEWLLFLDSDAKVVRKDFIAKYIEAMQVHSDHVVVQGGICHVAECLDPTRTLRWRYEKEYEAKVGSVGNFFTTFNFMISRETFNMVRFDETYKGYGGEDIKFGIDAKEKGVKLVSIDNPLLHSGLDTNEVYLRKVEESLETFKQHETELSCTKVVSFVRQHRVLSFVAGLLFPAAKRCMQKNLLGKKPNMKLFALYKLGYYTSLR